MFPPLPFGFSQILLVSFSYFTLMAKPKQFRYNYWKSIHSVSRRNIKNRNPLQALRRIQFLQNIYRQSETILAPLHPGRESEEPGEPSILSLPSPSPLTPPSLLFPSLISLEVGPLNAASGLGKRWKLPQRASPAGSGAEPQSKSNLVHFCLKMWHLLEFLIRDHNKWPICWKMTYLATGSMGS